MTSNNKNNKKDLLKSEWILKLVDASENAVKGYEQYLLDKINYSDLAKIMTELRDLLPFGCKETKDKSEE